LKKINSIAAMEITVYTIKLMKKVRNNRVNKRSKSQKKDIWPERQLTNWQPNERNNFKRNLLKWMKPATKEKGSSQGPSYVQCRGKMAKIGMASWVCPAGAFKYCYKPSSWNMQEP
jgi:hypothetical protein